MFDGKSEPWTQSSLQKRNKKTLQQFVKLATRFDNQRPTSTNGELMSVQPQRERLCVGGATRSAGDHWCSK